MPRVVPLTSVTTACSGGDRACPPGPHWSNLPILTLDTLADHQPAAFIATPVLKALPVAEVPGIEKLAALQSWFNPNSRQAFFIYGGLLESHSRSHPPGLSLHPLYGRSTNQEMLNWLQPCHAAARRLGLSTTHCRVSRCFCNLVI